jgi:hypothetical protein
MYHRGTIKQMARKHEFEPGIISVNTTFNPTFPHYPQLSLIFTRMQDFPTLLKQNNLQHSLALNNQHSLALNNQHSPIFNTAQY